MPQEHAIVKVSQLLVRTSKTPVACRYLVQHNHLFHIVQQNQTFTASILWLWKLLARGGNIDHGIIYTYRLRFRSFMEAPVLHPMLFFVSNCNLINKTWRPTQRKPIVGLADIQCSGNGRFVFCRSVVAQLARKSIQKGMLFMMFSTFEVPLHKPLMRFSSLKSHARFSN